jgi:hypothetical protein
MVAGGLTGAIVTGLLAGSAGCAIGSVAGNLADTNFLDNRACLECGHTFREDTEPTSVHVQLSAPAADTASVHSAGGARFDVSAGSAFGSGRSASGFPRESYED